MYAQVEKPKENKSRVVANSAIKNKSNTKYSLGFVDNRPKTIIQGVFTIPSNILQVSYRYLDSAEKHVTQQELRNDFINMENVVIPRWHETEDFDGGGNVNIRTTNLNYIVRFDGNANCFIIFHVDRGDKYREENQQRALKRVQEGGTYREMMLSRAKSKFNTGESFYLDLI